MSTLSKLNSERLSSALGYQFKDDSLLLKALSHRSVGSHNNERLEFLGDSLLNFIIAEALFQKFPEVREGHLTRLRANLVKGDTLADIAKEFNLGEYLQLGEGELKSGGYRRASILADTVEAILGAIYLESGMDICAQTVLRWYDSRLRSVSPDVSAKDSKTRLQEFMQERKKPLPKYEVLRCFGQSHSPEFEVSCDIGRGYAPTTAIAGSKRNAEQMAAEQMLQTLGIA
ncbi:ribonuclease III [Teredinibacter haidensis]|uniref:ribonuclease III n=1 Tax=Teredinibacter haidensis TaxID=2731755 RepID=UPI0009488BAB|nr:ribonuclease III [Teredinibacter haidensis]